MIDIILGSSSPRRKELIKKVGNLVQIINPAVDEDVLVDDNYPLSVAQAKMAVMPIIKDKLIVCADTIVKLDKEVFNKPKDQQDAANMLGKLRGKQHQVLTAVCLRFNEITIDFIEESLVVFKNFTDQELKQYLALEEYIGKSGSYACQGQGKSLIIDKIIGSVDNVIGLPTERIIKELKKIGINNCAK